MMVCVYSILTNNNGIVYDNQKHSETDSHVSDQKHINRGWPEIQLHYIN